MFICRSVRHSAHPNGQPAGGTSGRGELQLHDRHLLDVSLCSRSELPCDAREVAQVGPAPESHAGYHADLSSMPAPLADLIKEQMKEGSLI